MKIRGKRLSGITSLIKTTLSSKTKLLVALLLSFTLTIILLLPLCNLIFKCGCKALWSGAAEFCNINQVSVPHCPWCEARDPMLMTALFVVVFLGQGFSVYQFQNKSGAGIIGMLLVGALAFLILASIHGFIFKLIAGYPYFFTR